MGKYDKDRAQKELAIRYCLAKGFVPYLEVLVSNATELSDTSEVLTDIDVMGIFNTSNGSIKRHIFDCKTTNKLSAINRAFWASGVCSYIDSEYAFVILKNSAVHNHRLSALSINVELHDESSFLDLGRSIDISFNNPSRYQSSIDNWNAVYDAYEKNTWSSGIFHISRNIAPSSAKPASVYRQMIAETRSVKGNFDPLKPAHMAIFFDVMASAFICWTAISREIRRFYDPKISKEQFERSLLYYLWGGKEPYNVINGLKTLKGGSNTEEYPAWDKARKLAGLIIDAPHHVLDCATICRDLSIRCLCGSDATLDKSLSTHMSENNRFRQFMEALGDHFISATGLPQDTGIEMRKILSSV